MEPIDDRVCMLCVWLCSRHVRWLLRCNVYFSWKIVWKQQQQKYEGKAKEQTMAEINVCFVYNYGVNFQCVVLLPGLRICLKRKNTMRLWIIRREFYACTNCALCGYVLEFIITIVKVLFQWTSFIDIGILNTVFIWMHHILLIRNATFP